MRLAILKDRIENRACEDAGKTVVYLDEVVSGVASFTSAAAAAAAAAAASAK
jgi:hypothetical protein